MTYHNDHKIAYEQRDKYQTVERDNFDTSLDTVEYQDNLPILIEPEQELDFS